MLLMWKLTDSLIVGVIRASWVSNQPQETSRPYPKFLRMETAPMVARWNYGDVGDAD